MIPRIRSTAARSDGLSNSKGSPFWMAAPSNLQRSKLEQAFLRFRERASSACFAYAWVNGVSSARGKLQATRTARSLAASLFGVPGRASAASRAAQPPATAAPGAPVSRGATRSIADLSLPASAGALTENKAFWRFNECTSTCRCGRPSENFLFDPETKAFDRCSKRGRPGRPTATRAARLSIESLACSTAAHGSSASISNRKPPFWRTAAPGTSRFIHSVAIRGSSHSFGICCP